MTARYCKGCKHFVQEVWLHNGVQCPACGSFLAAPDEFKPTPKVKRVEQEYVVRIEFTSGKKGDMTISEEQFTKLNTTRATNVVSWYVLKQYDANSN